MNALPEVLREQLQAAGVLAVDPFDAVLEEIRELNERKRSDYTGGDPWENFKDSARQTNTTPGMSAETLIATKQSRLRQLLKAGRVAVNEPVRDSLLDRAVYSIIALALYDAGLYEEENS